MRLRDPRLWLGGTSLVAVLAVALVDVGKRTSPGPLAAVHEREAELAGQAGCSACHGSWRRTMAEACSECHAAVAEQLRDGGGLHGVLEPGVAEDCAACHGEHHGAGFALVTDRSFERAGADRGDFDHNVLGYQLEGRHDELGCVECHEQCEVEVLAKGMQRYGGLDPACTACHEDPHEGRMARGCAECHGQEGAFDDLTAFRHPDSFPLEGAHAGRECAGCHADAHTVEAVIGPAPPPARGCADCHDSPHGPPIAAAVREELACAACHGTAHDGFDPGAATTTLAQHAALGVPLEEPHDRLECAQCHDPALAFEARFPARVMSDCAACHADPHGDQFTGRACVECHAPLRFEPHLFGLEAHAAAAFPLTGAHARAECDGCHRDPEPGGVRGFVGTPGRCEACHEDVHRGAFAETCARCHGTETFAVVADFDHGGWTGFALEGAHERADCAGCHGEEPERRTVPRACASCHADPHEGRFDDAGGCASCHDAETWGHGARERFDHLQAGFPLRGAHAHADCAMCHPALPAPDALGRTFGRASERFDLPAGPVECGGCHADPHGGAFDRPGLPALVEGRAGCARCHAQTSFRALPDAGFDHGRWTGHALEGGHATLACFACHASTPEADALGRTYAPAQGTACADCHGDPHLGQFRVDGQNDCARCHSTSAAFGAPSFDHARDSRFALDKDHEKLECAACHKPWALPDGREVVRYRPLGVRCQDCHGFERKGAGG